jgi:hypothetical protein
MLVVQSPIVIEAGKIDNGTIVVTFASGTASCVTGWFEAVPPAVAEQLGKSVLRVGSRLLQPCVVLSLPPPQASSVAASAASTGYLDLLVQLVA